ncbi:uncharacterized protein BDV17DRAFT_180187 [Aspergillus undulatus]|uniref:uncharacterized protein n=1 Tax=Aspergillus undulatus TaxID=1810928 RepID=UPI003CCDAD92
MLWLVLNGGVVSEAGLEARCLRAGGLPWQRRLRLTSKASPSAPRCHPQRANCSTIYPLLIASFITGWLSPLSRGALMDSSPWSRPLLSARHDLISPTLIAKSSCWLSVPGLTPISIGSEMDLGIALIAVSRQEMPQGGVGALIPCFVCTLSRLLNLYLFVLDRGLHYS